MGENICPRCGGDIPNTANKGQYPGALSRWDNVTEICSECGSNEALLQFSAREGGADYVQTVVHPTLGSVVWAVLAPHVMAAVTTHG